MHTFSRAHARTVTTGAMTLAAGSLAVALAAGASAHVNVSSLDARQDGSGKIIVRVPSEEPIEGTVKVAINMPTDVTLTSVRAKPHFGWTFTMSKRALATPVKSGENTITEVVKTITWTADPGVSIKPGSFDEFEFTAGKMPKDKTTLSFPALQTYSDGKVVSWIEPKTEGAAEPEKPAPVLVLLPAKGSEKAVAVGATPVAATTDKAGSSDPLARGLGIGAGLVALAGVGLGLRRKSATAK